jgi:effector-binding domain-containing protein
MSMLNLPEIRTREAQHYIYVPFTVTMQQMQRPANEGFPQLFEYIERHGLTPVGDAFYNYRRINMADSLDVEAGIAVSGLAPDEGSVRNGLLPGGQFAEVTWIGHPDHLIDATAMLIGWIGLSPRPMDMVTRADGDHFACRLEIYESDPIEHPNMDEWVTSLAFKLAD